MSNFLVCFFFLINRCINRCILIVVFRLSSNFSFIASLTQSDVKSSANTFICLLHSSHSSIVIYIFLLPFCHFFNSFCIYIYLAPGAVVQCNSNNMTIIIAKSLLQGIDREHLRLLETKCKATETSAYFSLTIQLTERNTTRRHTASTILYSNTVLEIQVAAEDVITRVRELEI